MCRDVISPRTLSGSEPWTLNVVSPETSVLTTISEWGGGRPQHQRRHCVRGSGKGNQVQTLPCPSFSFREPKYEEEEEEEEEEEALPAVAGVNNG